jgi:hypothetical protein
VAAGDSAHVTLTEQKSAEENPNYGGGIARGPAAIESLAWSTRARRPRPHTTQFIPCLRWFLEFFTGCLPRLVLYSRNTMSDCTETLAVGSRAPEFLLSAANRDGILSLSGFLSRGALIVEFLRGTW